MPIYWLYHPALFGLSNNKPITLIYLFCLNLIPFTIGRPGYELHSRGPATLSVDALDTAGSHVLAAWLLSINSFGNQLQLGSMVFRRVDELSLEVADLWQSICLFIMLVHR